MAGVGAWRYQNIARKTVDDDALGYGLLSGIIALGLGRVHMLPAAGERPASPPHSRRPPTACSPGRLTLLSPPHRPGDEAQRLLGMGKIGVSCMGARMAERRLTQR